jgi:hypothetical protein
MVHVKKSHSTEKIERLWRMTDVDIAGEHGRSNVWNSTKVGVYSVPAVQGEAQFSHLFVKKAADN